MDKQWLCIEARFLSGKYHGRKNDTQGQWPPNPHRLLNALVAAGTVGYHRTSFDETKKNVLRWLETLPNPEIVAPEVRRSPAVSLSTPNNEMDSVLLRKKDPNKHRSLKTLYPHALSGDATVRFLWPISKEELQASHSYIESVCEIAQRLPSLGLGIDLVVGNGRILSDKEKQALSGEVWLADENGSGWRVPIKGSLDEILSRYKKRGKSVSDNCVVPPTPPVKCAEVRYRRKTQSGQRRTYLFKLVDRGGRPCSFNPCNTMEVAAWMRHAAHKKARDLKVDSHFIESFICGHGKSTEEKDNRLSYLPIPTIPAKGRDGGIRRVLIATPFNHYSKEEENIISNLDNMPLTSKQNELMANLQRGDEDRTTERYLRKGKVWGSVTPLVLPGHDDYRLRKANRLIIKSLKQAGYTTPIERIDLRNGPIFPGSEMARTYRVPAYLKGFTCIHAVLTFSEDVFGPVAIGAGRHIGLGIFARCPP